MPSAYDYVGRSTNFTGGTVTDGSVLSGLNDSISNFFTGDRAYARQLESMAFQNAFNASEAQKERDFSSSEAQKIEIGNKKCLIVLIVGQLLI